MGLFSRVLHREAAPKSHPASSATNATKLQTTQVKNASETTNKSFVVGEVNKDMRSSIIIQKQIDHMNKNSRIFDDVESLRTENNMLHEQVAQQKSFIERLTTELDFEKKENMQWKEKNEQLEKSLADATRSDLRDSQSSSSVSNNISLLLQNTPETSVSTTPDSYESKEPLQQQSMKRASQIYMTQDRVPAIPLTKEMNTTILHTQQSVLIESQRQTIGQLKKRVSELELQTRKGSAEREQSLNMLHTSMLAIKANRNFIGSSSSLISDEEAFPEPAKSLYTTNLPQQSERDGTTYVIESFKPF